MFPRETVPLKPLKCIFLLLLSLAYILKFICHFYAFFYDGPKFNDLILNITSALYSLNDPMHLSSIEYIQYSLCLEGK
jgi:hypothetical protein